MDKDVNQQLFDQRRAMIDSGGVTRRDDGTWVYADKSEVFGKEGLDMTSGEAALYSAVPAWHGLGNIIPGGTADIDTVLKLAHLDWDVQLVPAFYAPTTQPLLDDEGNVNHALVSSYAMRVHPNDKIAMRTDTYDSLGTVGNRYHTIQNRDAFTFLQDLCLNYGVPWESAGALRGGRKTFVSMRLPDNITIDAGGIEDTIIPFVAALNSHDGSSSFVIVLSPWRPVCANTERLAIKDAYTRWAVRHTKDATKRLHEARRTLQMSMDYFDRFKIEEESLAQASLAIDEFHAVINELWTPPDHDAEKAAHTRNANRHEALADLWTAPRNFPGTAYGAERAITEYLDHPERLHGKTAEEATRILEGADDDKKAKAHRRLMMLVA